jgi:predicted ATP-grasp superfamily ATP-dependent carboligase
MGNRALIGFPSVGLVGAFAVSYLVDHLKMKNITDLEFTEPMPMFTAVDGKVINPVQIYQKGKTYAVICNISLDLKLAYEFAKSFLSFAKKNSIQEIIIPRGVNADLPSIKDNSKVFGLIINEKLRNVLKKYEIKGLSNSTIFGSDAGLVSALKNYPGDVFFLYTLCGKSIPDNNAITTAITNLNKILGLQTNSKSISDKIDNLRKDSQNLIQQTKNSLKKDNSRSKMIGIA